jgi:hypothetical protein
VLPSEAGIDLSMRKEPSESESRGMRYKSLKQLAISLPVSSCNSRQASRVKEFRIRYICDLSCVVPEIHDISCISTLAV